MVLLERCAGDWALAGLPDPGDEAGVAEHEAAHGGEGGAGLGLPQPAAAHGTLTRHQLGRERWRGRGRGVVAGRASRPVLGVVPPVCRIWNYRKPQLCTDRTIPLTQKLQKEAPCLKRECEYLGQGRY